MNVRARTALLVVLGTAFAFSPALLAAPGASEIVDALPAVTAFPRAGLDEHTAHVLADQSGRAPATCSRAEQVRATARWAEWGASGRGRTVRVITFAYPVVSAGRVWRALRDSITACPRTSTAREDDGSLGTATWAVRTTNVGVISVDVVTTSASGASAWSRDRAIIYQRVGDAIQKVEVSRRIVTARDRAFARRVALVSRARYMAIKEGPGGGGGADAALADADGLVSRTIPVVPPGATLNVALGDSMASGEAGRWRGNVSWYGNWPLSDAYGAQAYWDTATGESVTGCHRAKGAGINVPGTYAINLACSGALTTSMVSKRLLDYGQYKPGVDDGLTDPSTGAHLPGQLTLLARVARQARVGTIVMSIGGNDMGFGEVMLACIGAFIRPWPFDSPCKDDPDVRRRLSDASLATVEDKVAAAIIRVQAVMKGAGYENGSWQMIVQGFPRLIAENSRYADTLGGRLYAGGCPVHSADVAWLNDRLPMTATMQAAARRASAATGQPVQVMDLSGVFAGRELCARGAAHVDDIPSDAVTARAERVQMAGVLPPFGRTEGFHPNQIGQQALQACIRAATETGVARSGRCEAPLDWARVDSTGLPLVRFFPT